MQQVIKQKQIQFIKDIFTSSKAIVLASVDGINAEEIASLRKKLHEAGVGFKVVKNRLAKIALRLTPANVISEDFKNSTAIAWSLVDEISPAKTLVEYQEGLEKFKIKSGYNSGQKFDLIKIKELAKLPNLLELRARLLGIVNNISEKLLSQISQPALHIVKIIQANIEKNKELK